MAGQHELGRDEGWTRSEALAGATQSGEIVLSPKLKYHLGMCLYLTILSLSNDIIGIKLLFNPVTDNVSLFRLQGQLGLGEDRIHTSTPCLLSYSRLSEVSRIQAGDSYSAAVTGEPSAQPAAVAYGEVSSSHQLYYFSLKVLRTIK